MRFFRNKLAFFLFLCYITVIASNTEISYSAARIISSAGYIPSSVGISVMDLNTDSLLYSLNGDKLYNPASVQKLITASVAFELLGCDFKFKTLVAADTFDIESGCVHNLYIKGNGDPGFTAERLWLLVQHIVHNGIKKISGSIILDDFSYSNKGVGPGYKSDGKSRAYEAPVGALSANFNAVAVHIAPGSQVGKPVRITPFPELKGVKIVSTAKTVASSSTSGISVKTEPVDGRTAIFVYGSVGLNEKPFYKYRKVWSTWENFGWMLLPLMEKAGIDFVGSIQHGELPENLTKKNIITEFDSDELPHFVNSMFKYSSNFAADMIFNAISANIDSSRKGTWEGSCRIVRKWLNDKNILKNAQVINGSGMGNGNRVTPNEITKIYMNANSNKIYWPEFLSALSVAGVDGTLKERFKNSSLKGILRGKTGTLNSLGVSNLTGVILLPKKSIVFAILVNDRQHSQYSAWILQEKLAELFYEKIK